MSLKVKTFQGKRK